MSSTGAIVVLVVVGAGRIVVVVVLVDIDGGIDGGIDDVLAGSVVAGLAVV